MAERRGHSLRLIEERFARGPLRLRLEAKKFARRKVQGTEGETAYGAPGLRIASLEVGGNKTCMAHSAFRSDQLWANSLILSATCSI